MSRSRLNRWVQAPFVTGWWALLCALAAVAIPTLIRYSANGVVTGCEFTPYLPFVLLAAILLRWWQAAAVALTAAVLFGELFIGPPGQFFGQSCAVTATAIFLGASAAIIATVAAARGFVAGMFSRSRGGEGEVIFSLEDGRVWASWYGQGPPVCLGSQDRVGEMMKDFLAQEGLAKRLAANGD